MPSLSNPVTIQSVAVQGAANRNRLEARMPKECTMALEMLADGCRYREVEEATGLTFEQIAAIKARNADAIEVRRKQLADGGYELAEKARELLSRKLDDLADNEDRFNKVSAKDMGILFGVLQDKTLMAAEGNKVVIEHRRGPSLEDAKAYLESLKAAVQKDTIEVEATDE